MPLSPIVSFLLTSSSIPFLTELRENCFHEKTDNLLQWIVQCIDRFVCSAIFHHSQDERIVFCNSLLSMLCSPLHESLLDTHLTEPHLCTVNYNYFIT